VCFSKMKKKISKCTKYLIVPLTQEIYQMGFNEITKFTIVTSTKTYHIKFLYRITYHNIHVTIDVTKMDIIDTACNYTYT